ncbi:hypothetical protein ACIA58_36345 [Kribbella sp. NPDC051586]|uniref:hypothetical protein n=1 Tax=Kribbella sp. NPDC051586 TaxID=3364118 RepID=UPI0037B141E5
MRNAKAAARDQQRDDRFSNVGNPAPTGAVDSSVSGASLTALAHERLAAVAGPTARSPKLDANLRAGLLPPGQTRAAGNAGARPQTGGPTARGNDRKGRAR